MSQTQSAPSPKLTLKEIQSRQLSGEDIPQATGNVDSTYTFPAHEATTVHVKLTKMVNDPVLKQYVEESVTKKYAPVQFTRMEKSGYFNTQNYDKVELRHDPRRPATQPATDTKPWEPVAGLPTLQDAQLRYQELHGHKAPAVSHGALLELIEAKLSEPEAESDETPAPRKAIRSLNEAKERYLLAFLTEAPADKNFADLKALVEAEEERLDNLGKDA